MASLGSDIQQAKKILEAGALVAIPTETVYGLAGNALNPLAVAKIFEVKNRPFFDPLIVHVASWQKVNQYAHDIPNQAKILADHFWPGPLTLLLNKKENIPDLVTAGLDRVGLRCPQHPLTLALLKDISFPMAAPSANPFGYVSPTTAQHVQDQLGEKISYILDGGSCEIGIESTVIGWEDDLPVVYRLGGVNLEQIESIIGPVKVLPHSTSQPHAPGQLKSHYAPRKKFLLGNLKDLAVIHGSKRTGVLAFQNKIEGIPLNLQLVLSPTGDLKEAARNLFSMLREFDTMDIEMVFAEEVPNEGLGRAINDRLRRAAAANN